MQPWNQRGMKRGGKGGGKGFQKGLMYGPPSFSSSSGRQPNKHFKPADDEMALLRNGVVASLNLGLDNARISRMLAGILIPTCLVPDQKSLREALAVEPDLQNPMQEMCIRWRKLGKGLADESKVSQNLREQIAAQNAKIAKDSELFGIVTHCSVYPCFENKDLIKIELTVQPELRHVLVLYFQALVELGGTTKFCSAPRRHPERQAQEALNALYRR